MATRGVMDLGTADDGSLQAAAIGGDGQAFAELYDRHEQRVYGFCLRVLGSPDDAADATQETFVRMLQRLPALKGRELNFVAYVLTSARHVCYDTIASRRTVEPVAEAPEPPISTPGSLEEDPERAALLSASREQVEVAVAALPTRQREVLALREVESLSYDEIAEIMEIKANAVAQLISRARIKLRESLRGDVAASIASTSPDCDLALPLIAMRQDGEHSSQTDWLRSHLSACATCRARQATMQEAGVSYRLLLPIVPLIWLRQASIARAADWLGVDWSEVASSGAGSGTGTGSGPAGPAGAAGTGAAAAGSGGQADAMTVGGAKRWNRAARGPLRRVSSRRRRDAALAIVAFLAVLLLLAGSLGDHLQAASAPTSSIAPGSPTQFAAPIQVRRLHAGRRSPVHKPRRQTLVHVRSHARHAGAVRVGSGGPATGSDSGSAKHTVASQPSNSSPAGSAGGITTQHPHGTHHAPGAGSGALHRLGSPQAGASGQPSSGSGGGTLPNTQGTTSSRFAGNATSHPGSTTPRSGTTTTPRSATTTVPTTMPTTPSTAATPTTAATTPSTVTTPATPTTPTTTATTPSTTTTPGTTTPGTSTTPTTTPSTTTTPNCILAIACR